MDITEIVSGFVDGTDQLMRVYFHMQHGLDIQQWRLGNQEEMQAGKSQHNQDIKIVFQTVFCCSL